MCNSLDLPLGRFVFSLLWNWTRTTGNMKMEWRRKCGFVASTQFDHSVPGCDVQAAKSSIIVIIIIISSRTHFVWTHVCLSCAQIFRNSPAVADTLVLNAHALTKLYYSIELSRSYTVSLTIQCEKQNTENEWMAGYEKQRNIRKKDECMCTYDMHMHSGATSNKLTRRNASK